MNRTYSSVLLIDDSNIDRYLSETVIRGDLFADAVISCSSVDQGLDYLESLADFPERLPEVIFLDVNMPLMDGFDFLNNFLRLPEGIQNHCTIFMVSATSSIKDIERIKTYPVVRKFFQKPLTTDILNDIRACIASLAFHK